MPGLPSCLHPFLSEYCIVHHWMQMEQFIFLSLWYSAGVSLAWPFPSEGIEVRPVVPRGSGTEVFNNCRRILFSWILITLIKGIDQRDPGVFIALNLHTVCALTLSLTSKCTHVIVYKTCQVNICIYILCCIQDQLVSIQHMIKWQHFSCRSLSYTFTHIKQTIQTNDEIIIKSEKVFMVEDEFRSLLFSLLWQQIFNVHLSLPHTGHLQLYPWGADRREEQLCIEFPISHHEQHPFQHYAPLTHRQEHGVAVGGERLPAQRSGLHPPWILCLWHLWTPAQLGGPLRLQAALHTRRQHVQRLHQWGGEDVWQHSHEGQ